MPISSEFQRRFQELVAEMNIENKTAASQQIGIAHAQFFNAYNYGIIPKPKTLMRIADFFNISIEYLLGMTENDSFEKAAHTSAFHDRLFELLEAHNISPSELSQKTHIHRSNISQWKTKKTIPLLDDLIIVADEFNVSLDYLLGRTDSPHN